MKLDRFFHSDVAVLPRPRTTARQQMLLVKRTRMHQKMMSLPSVQDALLTCEDKNVIGKHTNYSVVQ